jgi:hypothetical protein
MRVVKFFYYHCQSTLLSMKTKEETIFMRYHMMFVSKSMLLKRFFLHHVYSFICACSHTYFHFYLKCYFNNDINKSCKLKTASMQMRKHKMYHHHRSTIRKNMRFSKTSLLECTFISMGNRRTLRAILSSH